MKPIEEIAALREELARAQKQAAAMREALFKCSSAWKWLARNPAAPIAGTCRMDAVVVQADELCSSIDSGSNYISKESVAPLVAALAHVLDWCCDEEGSEIDADQIAEAIAHARLLGLL